MKMFTTLLRQNVQVFIALISIACVPYIAFAIEEPIATIGQPRPVQHAYLDNETIVRVVPTHIQIVDANTGEVLEKFGNFDSASSYDVVFSPTGSHVAVSEYSGNLRRDIVKIWDVNTREQIAEWEIEGYIDVAAFSPTQPLLAISIDDEIYLWNWQTGENLGMMIGERRQADTCYYVNGRRRTCWSPIHDFASVFSSDGRYLIVASMRPDIELWNVETRQLEGHFEGHTGNWVDGVVVSPDGTRIASFDRIAGFVYVWHMKAQHLLWKAKSAIGGISQVTFSPDSERLYVASRTGGVSQYGTNPWEGWDEKVRVWDVNSGQQIDMFETEFKGLKTIRISPDGKTALLFYIDGEIMWDIENKRIDRMWTDFVAEWSYTDNNDVALSPDGKTALAISPCFIKSWDVTSQQMRLLVSAEDYRFNTVTISPDSQKFAVGKEPFVEIRDIQTGKIETQFPHHIQLPEKITFSSSGKWLAVKDHWAKVDILNVEFPENKQRLIPPFELGVSSSYQIGFSENEQYFTTSGRTKIDNNNYKYWIVLWKREEGTFVFQYAWEGAFASSPAFMTDPDGSTVLAGKGKNGIHIWKLLPDAPQLLTTLDGEYPIQFSPDGRYLFAYRDENFQIWDWQRSRLINQPSLPWFVNMSQDGSLLLTYSYSQREYQLWDLNNLLSFLPYPVEPKGKQFVTLGQIKKNQLLQNFPNPFNPETWIPFRLADKSDVTIRIYTPTGQLVRSLSLGSMSAGDYSSQSQAIHWDGHNDKGESVSSGVYLYTIDAGDFSATRKMLIRK